MSSASFESEDLLLRRLREGASGDATVRQLRRRYDLLRTDYEALLDRLAFLEERLTSDPATSADTAPSKRESEEIPPSVKNFTDALVAPLLQLRNTYLDALAGIESIVAGLENIAAGAMKGQHSATAVAPRPTSATPRPRTVQVKTRGAGFGEMLDFQERLSGMPGIARVSIEAIESDRATFIVEMDPR